MDDGGHALHGLHQVGHDGVAHDGHERAGQPEVADRHRVSAAAGPHNDAGNPGAQIIEIGRQGEDRHDFGSGDEVEPGLTERAVGVAAQAGGYLPEGAVGRVGDPGPGNAFGSHIAGLVAVHRVLYKGRQQVVRGADGVGVAGEMDVDLVLGNDPGLAAAGSTALDSEDGAQGRLTEVYHGLVTQPAEPVGQADGSRGFAFAGRGGGDAGYDHELAARAVLPNRVEGNLGLGVAEGNQVLMLQAQAFCHKVDGVHVMCSGKSPAVAGLGFRLRRRLRSQHQVAHGD